MPQDGQRARLEDVINYRPEQYFSEADIELIRSTFKGNPALIKVLRKALIPMIADPELPLESFADDSFMQGRDYAQIPESEIKALVVARQDAIKYIAGALIKLQVIANYQQTSPEALKAKREKDSTK